MKNFKKFFLICAMVLCLGGGIGATVAAITKTAAGQSGTGAFDQAINLYWTKESTTITLADATDIEVNVPKYRYLTVMPKSTEKVAGNVQLDFTMAAGATERHVKGVTISVFKTSELATDATVAGLIADVTAEPVLTASSLTGNTKFAVAASTGVHETTAYYAIQIVYDGSNDSEHPTYEMGGSLTIHQSFVA